MDIVLFWEKNFRVVSNIVLFWEKNFQVVSNIVLFWEKNFRVVSNIVLFWEHFLDSYCQINCRERLVRLRNSKFRDSMTPLDSTDSSLTPTNWNQLFPPWGIITIRLIHLYIIFNIGHINMRFIRYVH
jgi:hypothetical protein